MNSTTSNSMTIWKNRERDESHQSTTLINNILHLREFIILSLKIHGVETYFITFTFINNNVIYGREKEKAGFNLFVHLVELAKPITTSTNDLSLIFASRICPQRRLRSPDKPCTVAFRTPTEDKKGNFNS